MATKSRRNDVAGDADIRVVRRGGKQAAFLAALATGVTLSDACLAAGIDPRTQRRWRVADKKFAAAFRDALGTGTDRIGAEVFRRATVGVSRPILYQGKPVIDPETGKPFLETTYSDTLLMFLLKSRDPETYDDRVRAEKIARKWAKRDARAAGDASDYTVPEGILAMLDRIVAEKAQRPEPEQTQEPDAQH